jgi:drug/metabolite transporter (DMT)-like permease
MMRTRPRPVACLPRHGRTQLSTALAYNIYFQLLARAGATNLLLVTLLVPVSALLLATSVLGETLQARQMIGMGLIALGLAAIDGRPVAVARAAMHSRRDG